MYDGASTATSDMSTGAAILRQAMGGGRALAACFLSTGSTLHAEVIATAGFDAVIVDGQHGLVSDHELAPLIRTLERDGVPAIVRVARNAPELIGRGLDAGAAGVIVPMVDTVEDAYAAVAAARYPPQGSRSYGALRASLRGSHSTEQENAELVLAIMVETAPALAAVDDLLAVPGVDAVFTGPADLALSLGLPPTLSPEPGSEHEQAILRIAQAARAARTAAWIAGGSTPAWRRWAEAGYGLVSVASDVGLLRGASRAAAREARAQG